MIPENTSEFQDYTSADVSAAPLPRPLDQVCGGIGRWITVNASKTPMRTRFDVWPAFVVSAIRIDRVGRLAVFL